MTCEMAPDLDRHARACYCDAQRHLSVRTVAELHRRRISACNGAGTNRSNTRRFAWPLAAALGSVGALALGLGVWWPHTLPADAPAAIAGLDTLDALEAINLTALDEDSDFFLWLATQDASLLAME